MSAILLGVRDMDRYRTAGRSSASTAGYIWSIGYSAQGQDQPYAD